MLHGNKTTDNNSPCRRPAGKRAPLKQTCPSVDSPVGCKDMQEITDNKCRAHSTVCRRLYSAGWAEEESHSRSVANGVGVSTVCRWLPTGAELSPFRQQRPCSLTPAPPRNGQALATVCDARLLIQGGGGEKWHSPSSHITENALDQPGCPFLEFGIHLFLNVGSGSLPFSFNVPRIFRARSVVEYVFQRWRQARYARRARISGRRRSL